MGDWASNVFSLTLYINEADYSVLFINMSVQTAWEAFRLKSADTWKKF